MFFEKTSEIPAIASRIGTGVFVVPQKTEVIIPDAIVLKPEQKTTITIEQVREILAKIGMKQFKDLYIVIRPAEKLGLESANALLKSLEEPGEKVHFVLITDQPSQILPTILSRAEVYFLKENFKVDGVIEVDEEVKMLAKKLMTARGVEFVEIADKIAKKKDSRRYALEVLGTAIEMLYKTYFLTNKEIYIKKIPNYLIAYDAISRNGNVKLQLVANL